MRGLLSNPCGYAYGLERLARTCERSRAQTALFAPEGGGWLTGCERRGSSTGIRQTVLFGQDSPSDRDWPGLTIDSIFLTARGSGYVMEQLREGSWLRE